MSMTRCAADPADRLPEVDNRVLSSRALDPVVCAVLAALHEEIGRIPGIAAGARNTVAGHSSRRRYGAQRSAGIAVAVPVRPQYAVREQTRGFRCSPPRVCRETG